MFFIEGVFQVHGKSLNGNDFNIFPGEWCSQNIIFHVEKELLKNLIYFQKMRNNLQKSIVYLELQIAYTVTNVFDVSC